MKFSVVPDSSERWTGVMAWSGSVLPGLSAAISGAFQLVILPRKMPAIVAGASCRSVTPGQVVDHGDRGDVGRDLDDVAAAALLGLR